MYDYNFYEQMDSLMVNLLVDAQHHSCAKQQLS